MGEWQRSNRHSSFHLWKFVPKLTAKDGKLELFRTFWSCLYVSVASLLSPKHERFAVGICDCGDSNQKPQFLPNGQIEK
jgi:hypothetical protein